MACGIEWSHKAIRPWTLAGSSCSSAAGTDASNDPGSAGSEVYSDVGCSSATLEVVVVASVSEPSCTGDAAGTSGGDPALGVSAALPISSLPLSH
jgi:hypothetical protein